MRHRSGSLALAAIVALAIVAGCSTEPAAPSSPPGSAEATARHVVQGILARQPEGKLVAAVYVVSSFGEYQNLEPPEQRYTPDGVSASDRVVVVKLFGQFPSAHSGPKGVNTDSTVIVDCYDLTLAADLETGYFTGPEPADIPGAAAGTSPTDVDLRKLGTPKLVQP